MSSAIATAIDILLFTLVFTQFLPVLESELISGFIGMVINFILQKKYVFDLQRNQIVAFMLSIALSFLALFLGGLLIDFLVGFELLAAYLIIPKLMVMAAKFFFNYFTKRWIFEKKGINGKPIN